MLGFSEDAVVEVMGISKVVVQDEAKAPDNVEFILHLVAIESDDLLRFLKLAIYLLSLVHEISQLGPEGQAWVIIELQEIGRVLHVASRDLSHRLLHLLNFHFVVPAESRRYVVLTTVVEGELE